MTTLFSPIGTADPVTQLGYGPMLHIVRHRRPDKVVLFLSPAMSEFEREDHRYTRAIEALCECDGAPCPEVEVVESSFEEVHRFDHYIDEFEAILKPLCAEAGCEPVLANATSGTPGMEQALVALGSFGRLNMELLQVATPRKATNERHDRVNPREFDFDELWEWSFEVEDPVVCRIEHVSTPNFADRLLKEHVVSLVKGYEYEAAYELVKEIRTVNPEAVLTIRAAADRLNLDGGAPAKIFGGTPLKYRSNDLLAEYLCIMEVRLKQGHWAEFLRAMTPAFTEIVKRVLEPYVAPACYLQVKNGTVKEAFDWDKIDEDERLCKTIKKVTRGIRAKYPTNGVLVALVGEYCEDELTVERVEKLRMLEEGSRNPIAHQLTSSARRSLERQGGMSLEDAMESLFSLHGSVEPGLYDRVNNRIIDELG